MTRLPVTRLVLSAAFLCTALLLSAASGCSSDPNIEGAKLEMRNGDYERVIELTDRAIAANDQNAEAFFLRGEAYRNLAERSSDAETRAQNIDRMVEAYERARTLDPNDGAIELGLLQAYGAEMNRGAAAFGRGSDDPAMFMTAAEAFGNASRIMPDSTDGYLNRGLSLLAGGQTAEAAEPLQMAVERNASAPEAYLYLGRIYLSEDRADEAIAVLETARERFPDDDEIESELLNVYGRTGQTDRALEAYATAVQQQPDNAVMRYNYGSFLLQAGRNEEAIEHLSRSVEIDGDNPNAHYNLGAAYVNQVVEINQELSDLASNDPSVPALEQRRNELLSEAVVPLGRARVLLEADGQDATPVCETLFRAYAQLGRTAEMQAAAECAGIDLN